MPVTSSPSESTRVITMQVGDSRKVMSKTIFSEISLFALVGPAYYLRSSDPDVIKIESRYIGSEAWVKAIAPGRAEILYIHREGQITPIKVIP